MSAAGELGELGRGIPQFFYDLVAYYSSSSLLFAVIFFFHIEAEWVHSPVDISAAQVTVFLLLFVFSAYVYGQLSNSLSWIFVSRPLLWLLRIIGKRTSSEFVADRLQAYEFDYGKVVKAVRDLPEFNEVKASAKSFAEKSVTSFMLYYITLRSPRLADTLIKEHARTDLARANTFNTLLIAVYLVAVGSWWPLIRSSWLGSALHPLWWALIFAVIMICFCIEYFLRYTRTRQHLLEVYAAVNKADRERIESPE